MPELRNCIRCGKVFAYTYNPVCNKCLEQEEEEFKRVKEYIYENPGSTVFEVSDATGISVEKIMKFLREERLELSSDNTNLLLECESCGRPIKSGRYCEECKNQIASEMKREFGLNKSKHEYAKTSGKERMHVIRKREGR
ncbi:TIGR03826 family flagellar region protein [Lutispora sp.]|uniref:TIGR03826 family flagellar region protein n=1 Tax=Lutispora sp. TaxID=2828727 RepID=UPI0035617722